MSIDVCTKHDGVTLSACRECKIDDLRSDLAAKDRELEAMREALDLANGTAEHQAELLAKTTEYGTPRLKFSDEPCHKCGHYKNPGYIPLAQPDPAHQTHIRCSNCRGRGKEPLPVAAATADGEPDETAFHAFTCPQCGGHTWGTNTSAPKEADWTVRCHSDGCTFTGLYNNHISNAAAPAEEEKT